MGAYTTLSVSNEEYALIIQTLKNGYMSADGKKHRPNVKTAEAVQCEYNLGLRISDVVRLALAGIVKDGDHYRLNITEKKTGKKRVFVVPMQYYEHLAKYCEDNHISKEARIFPITERIIQRHIKEVREYLQLDKISTHSFRKAAAAEVYKATGHDIEAAREFLQQSSVKITQRYLTRSSAKLEKVINNHTKIL